MRRTTLLPAEQETIILWDNELDTAQISTCDPRLIAKLEALMRKYPEQLQREESQEKSPQFYRVPKHLVTVRAPYNEARRQKQIRQAAAGCGNFMRGAEKDAEN